MADWSYGSLIDNRSAGPRRRRCDRTTNREVQVHRKLFALVAVLAALLVVAPAASAGQAKAKASWGWYYGATTLEVDPGTLGALTSLGVAPGAVAPAELNGATYSFPITSSLRSALRTGVVRHKGGISLTAGATTVKLTDFDIRLLEGKLYGKVNGAGPVALLDLDYSGLGIRFRSGRINIGPVGTTLTQGAADALNAAFGVSALSDDTVVGDATIRYRLFAF